MTQPIIKFATKRKFEGKILDWYANDPKGLNRPFSQKSGFAVNEQRHLSNDIRPFLIFYIRGKYNDGGNILWADLASGHYFDIVLSHFYLKNITFVKKLDNPAYVLETRLIDQLCSYLKYKVF